MAGRLILALTLMVVSPHSAHHEDVHQRAEQYQRHCTQAAERNTKDSDREDRRQGYQAAEHHDQGMLILHLTQHLKTILYPELSR